MCVEEAKKIFAGDVATVSPEILQEAAKIILSELVKAEEKISEIEKNFSANLPGEIWRDVVGYEGLYKVSNKGRVKSFKQFGVWIIRKNTFEKLRGYYAMYLSDSNGKRKHFLIHTLVANAFLPNENNFPIVNHKDGNKLNNCVENLEWCSFSQNMRHAHSKDLFKSSPVIREKRDFIRKNYIPYDKEFGAVALAKKFGLSERTVRNIAHSRTYSYDEPETNNCV